MNILVINQPLNNRGDESAHKALLRAIVSTISPIKVKVLFIDKNPDSIRQFNVNQPNVDYVNLESKRGYGRLYEWFLKHNNAIWPFLIHPTLRKVWEYYKWSDLVLCAPGGICMGGFQVWQHLFFLKIAKLSKRPLAYYGRSIGPFPTTTEDNRRFKALSEEMMNYFSFFSLRDRKSEKLADEMGFKFVSTVDSAFLDLPRVRIPLELKEQIGDRPYIVYVPNLLIWHFLYKQHTEDEALKLFDLIAKELVKHYPNHKYVMLPQLFNSLSEDYQDIVFFKKLKDYSRLDNMIVTTDSYSSDIQQSIIANAELVVGARYHSVVFALNNNIPCVALSYESKISGLLETLNKTEYLCDISKALDSEKSMHIVVKKVGEIIEKLPKQVNTKKEAEEHAQVCFKNFIEFAKSL